MLAKFALIYETNNSAIKTNQSVLAQIQFSREGEPPEEYKKSRGGGGVKPQKQLLSLNLFSCPITHLYSPQRSPRISFGSSPLARPHPCPDFFSGHPLVLISKKRRVHGCQIALKNTMKDWFAALFIQPALFWRELNGKPASRGRNKDVLPVGKGGNCPFCLSPSTLEKEGERQGAIHKEAHMHLTQY